jgi:hypothetical protein
MHHVGNYDEFSCIDCSLQYYDENEDYREAIKLNYTPWLQPASEQYRPSDHCLSAKLVPTFADRGCDVDSASDPHGRILGFLYPERYFSIQVAPQLSSRG